MSKRVAVLISGRGSNLAALIRAADFRWKGRILIACVVCNRAESPGLAVAQEAGIPTWVCELRSYSSRLEFENAIGDFLSSYGVDLVCLAGFMHVLGGEFLQSWSGKVINIHPSLLPSFRGLKAQQQALASGVKIAGCTVHYVEEQVDCGPIILQAAVPVLPDDEQERLSARILQVEHMCYPIAVEKVLLPELLTPIPSGEGFMICC